MALYGKIKAKLGGKPFCTMVVLAAGSSKRMGRDKLMMEVGGVPVLVRSLQAMQNCAAVDELIVVTRTSRLEEIACAARPICPHEDDEGCRRRYDARGVFVGRCAGCEQPCHAHRRP
ncbi:MAG: NTP transferase domain-containing protein [Oscillospiraceae bacterium]